MDPDAHAALRAVAEALASCATVSRSMFRPTRAIQSFSFQRWAPEPRGITATGSEPASDGEPTLSPRRAHSGGRPLRRNGLSTEPMARRRGAPRAPVPVAPGFRLEPSRPPCGETERRPDSSAPPPVRLASTALARLSPASDPRISTSACAILTTHGHVRRSSRQPDCAALRPRLLPP